MLIDKEDIPSTGIMPFGIITHIRNQIALGKLKCLYIVEFQRLIIHDWVLNTQKYEHSTVHNFLNGIFLKKTTRSEY